MNPGEVHTNNTTLISATTFGILLAFAGFEHGFFEMLQGNTRTPGLIIQAIGKSMQWWPHGSEEAFTIIPNFLVTGVLAMLVSIFIMVWSVKYLTTKHGTTVFLLSFILLTLFGGGIGYTPYFLMTWGYATQINKPLVRWRKILSKKVRTPLWKIWKAALFITGFSWLAAIEIAIFGYVPGVSDADTALHICWLFLFSALIFINVSFISAFARDIEQQEFKY